MSYICDICGKGAVVGSTQRHKRGVAGKRWRKRAQSTSRTYKPNLQKIGLRVGDKVKQMRVCAKCIKRIRKFGSVKNYKSISVS